MTRKEKKIIKPGNELTAASVDDLRKKLIMSSEQKVKKIVLDLAKVDTLDSVGLGLILATHNTLKNSGGDLELINVSKDVYDMFHAMRLDRHLEIQGHET